MLPADLRTLICNLPWGLGDVLLSTSAIREYKTRHPETRIVYRTFLNNRGPGYRLQYEKGNPGEILRFNPDIFELIDMAHPAYFPEPPASEIEFKYAWFGGPSLDYPIQAHYWENLGLEWTNWQRFDSHYYPQASELEWANSVLGAGPHLVMTPRVGWAGKMWTDENWRALTRWAVRNDFEPIVLAGERVPPEEFPFPHVRNFSGQLDMRQTAAILATATHAVMTEGGLSNLRFAVGKPAILLTCATQVGVQIWTPPELTTEVRAWQTPRGDTHYGTDPLREGGALAACSPCMWRGEHVQFARNDVPPASIRNCPADRSLRDIPAEAVIAILERSLA